MESEQSVGVVHDSKLTVLGQALPLVCAFFPFSCGVTNPIGRLGGSGGVMSSRSVAFVGATVEELACGVLTLDLWGAVRVTKLPQCQTKTRTEVRVGRRKGEAQTASASALRIYSAARSCKVKPPELSSLTLSQRSSTMRRLRSSSASSARVMPSLASQSRRWASSTRVGSLDSSAR